MGARPAEQDRLLRRLSPLHIGVVALALPQLLRHVVRLPVHCPQPTGSNARFQAFTQADNCDALPLGGWRRVLQVPVLSHMPGSPTEEIPILDEPIACLELLW
jgi:hypothetical protein